MPALLRNQHSPLALALVLAAALPAGAEPSKQTITYKQTEQGGLELDLYLPSDKAISSKPLPVIVYTHGGGWAAGSKNLNPRHSMGKVMLGVTKAGYALASVQYRLAKKDSGVTIRDCVVDSKDAARYLAKHADELSLDTDRFYAFGDSAGGHLAQMLLLSPLDAFPGDDGLAGAAYKMVAGVSWYGPCDFEKVALFNHPDGKVVNDRFGPRILGRDHRQAKDKLERYREVSPINYLKSDSPPLLMMQGDKDTTIPVHHAHYMKERAEELGAAVETIIVKNSGHNWRSFDGPTEPTREEIVAATVEFLTKQ